jgi:hypothetical protein
MDQSEAFISVKKSINSSFLGEIRQSSAYYYTNERRTADTRI